MRLEYVEPGDIEGRSFAIIEEETGGRPRYPETWPVVRRAIHATADFDYADNLCFSPGCVGQAMTALRAGAHVLTDTQMALAGVNRRVLEELGGKGRCFMTDEDVRQEARARGITRASVCMERGIALPEPLVVAVGNAPTALVRLHELIGAGKLRPALIVGVPVGFVNVVEAKELIMTADVPYIVARGRKGGSNVAAAIVNALLLLAREQKEKELDA